MKSIFKCPKCFNSTLSTALCEDNIVVVSCSHKFSNNTFCDFYTEMKQINLSKKRIRFIEKIDKL